MKLKIAGHLSLPTEAVTQTIGILAKRRAGKSYTARRLVEQLVAAGLQVVIVDPKGDWWGIRASADGKGPGLPITILGGERGDVPLEKSGGELVAKLVVEERVSALLDLSLFRKGEVAVFMTGFLEALYRIKAREIYRTPVMLVIDEADAIAPQKPQKGEERMLGAAEDIVRRGGQRGIGCTLITQRSAVLNKNVLTQVQILIALRTIAPQDLKALDAWIDVHGTEEERGTLMASLPALPVGDAWVWSPGWPTSTGIFERVHVLPIETFDSGETPKPGQKRSEPKTLADVDLEALRRQMADVVKRAEESDPKALRARVVVLERELAAAKRAAPASPAPPAPELFEQARAEGRAAAGRAARDQLSKVVASAEAGRGRAARAIDQASAEVKRSSDALLQHLQRAADALREPIDVPELEALKVPERQVAAARAPLERRASVAVAAPRRSLSGAEAGSLGAERRLLEVLVSRAPARFTKAQLGTLAGLAWRGGTFSTYLSRLRTAGFLEEDGDLLAANEEAISACGGAPPAPTSPEEVQTTWRRALGEGAAGRLLDALIAQRDEWISRDELAETCGLTSSGGTFSTYLSRLRSNGLLEECGSELRAAAVLFEG